MNAFVFAAVFVLFTVTNAKMLQGSDKQCVGEGESVTIPGITDDPCIDCFCRSGRVECQRARCSSLDSCHAVLYDRPPDSCCDVCKGCKLNETHYASGASWTDPSDHCIRFKCQAGVVTRSRDKCYVDCDHPVHLPGECCPSCSDCFYDGVDRLNGETFPHRSHPDVECTCKAGQVTCPHRACPVPNCPDDTVYIPKGERCPRCKGARKIFDLPTSCFFAKRVFAEGTIIQPDDCTSCTCWAGTVVCDREVCPLPTCDISEFVYTEGSCCPKCKRQRVCVYGNRTYPAGHHWVMDRCQQCRCDDGVMYCSRQTCPNVHCPPSHSLKFKTGACCPQCIKDDAVCTVTTGARHTTFDGNVFHAPGKCRYHMVRACSGNSFYVKIRNSPRTTDEFWTELVTVGFANFTVHLYRGMMVRVNGRKVRLPHLVPPHFAVRHIGNSLVVNAYDYHGLKVIWDGQTRLEVTVSKAHRNKLCGLCGNNNGDPQDDMVDKLGRHVTSPARFLASWQVLGMCHRQRGPKTADLIAACVPGTAGAERAEKVCTRFLHGELAACSARIDILPYISMCLHDSCRCVHGGECHVRSIKSLARRCIRAGFDVKWWHVAAG